jgi:general secretion pathway protein N
VSLADAAVVAGMPDNQPRPKPLRLILAGVAAFLITLLATIPASVIRFALPPTIKLGITSGTIWHGYADSLTVNGRPYGQLRWTLRPLQSFLGRLVLEGELIRNDGQARGKIGFGLGSRFFARNLEINLPLAAVASGIGPPGWNGLVRAKLQSVDLAPQTVPRVVGTIELRGLQAPPPGGAAIGSYAVTFDPASASDGNLVGQIKDLEGPMEVTGTATIAADRSYVIEGLVAPRADAPKAVTDTLRFLGAPDAQGRRPFSVAGTY